MIIQWFCQFENMKNYQKTIIFIEPPGNIQKELHAMRISCAQLTRTATILAFPELIPIMILNEGDTIDLSNLETQIRGKIEISMQVVCRDNWLALPTNIAHNKLVAQQENFNPSWQFGYITLGPQIIRNQITDILAHMAPLSFATGRLLLTDVTLLNDEGTSYVINFRKSLFRKKQNFVTNHHTK